MGRLASQVYLFQAAGVAMALGLLSLVVWGVFFNSMNASQPVVAIRIFKTPLELMNAASTSTPALRAWASNWQKSHASAQSSAPVSQPAEQLQALQSLVAQCALSPMDCFQISKMLADKHDLSAAEIWATGGTDRAEAQWAGADHSDVVVLPLLGAIQAAEEPLWAKYSNGALLERITTFLLKFDRANEWDQRPEWARIGHGESLCMQHRYMESMAEANRMAEDAAAPKSHFTPEQRIGIAWLGALNLVYSHQYQRALPYLAVVTSYPKFKHSKDAWEPLMLSLSHLGRRSEADAKYQEYIRLYHPAEMCIRDSRRTVPQPRNDDCAQADGAHRDH